MISSYCFISVLHGVSLLLMFYFYIADSIITVDVLMLRVAVKFNWLSGLHSHGSSPVIVFLLTALVHFTSPFTFCFEIFSYI